MLVNKKLYQPIPGGFTSVSAKLLPEGLFSTLAKNTLFGWGTASVVVSFKAGTWPTGGRSIADTIAKQTNKAGRTIWDINPLPFLLEWLKRFFHKAKNCLLISKRPVSFSLIFGALKISSMSSTSCSMETEPTNNVNKGYINSVFAKNYICSQKQVSWKRVFVYCLYESLSFMHFQRNKDAKFDFHRNVNKTRILDQLRNCKASW